jgi:triacylglycerol lipase
MKLVFASGFLVPQHPSGINYFRDLKDHLEAQGHETLFPDVAPLASCEERAIPLAEQIDKKYPNGDIHIIAHSMGGLDSRVLIFHNHRGLSERIKSLSTISTPHAGSPVADLFTGGSPGDENEVLELIGKIIRDSGLPEGALEDLRTDRNLPDPRKQFPDIRYLSYAAVGRPAAGLLRLRTCRALVPTHAFIREVTGEENDGLVSLSSSSHFDGFQEDDLWQCDHADAIGWNLDNPLSPQFPHLARYDAIISSWNSVRPQQNLPLGLAVRERLERIGDLLERVMFPQRL